MGWAQASRLKKLLNSRSESEEGTVVKTASPRVEDVTQSPARVSSGGRDPKGGKKG